MVVARQDYVALIARAFDGAIVVDGQRVVAHKSGMHVVRGPSGVSRAEVFARNEIVVKRPSDRDNDWSDV